MKRKMFILEIFVSVLFFASAQKYQDTEYFTKKISVSSMFSDTVVFLYEKGNHTWPRATPCHGMRNLKALYENIAMLLEKEFPTKPDSKTIDMLKDICFDLVYNGRGEVRFYHYRMKLATYRSIPDLERKLYRIITAIKAEGMLKYDLRQGAPLDSCSPAGCGFKPAIKFMWKSND